MDKIRSSMNKLVAALSLFFLALVLVNPAHAAFQISVVQLNSYAGSTAGKFLWASNGIGAGCPGGALQYDGSGDGGKALYAMLLTALVTGKQVDINVSGSQVTTSVGTSGNGCTLLEAYIR